MAYFTPICVSCHMEMRCKRNDYLFADYDNAAIWAGDMYECPQCRRQVVVGVPRLSVCNNPEHVGAYDSHFTLTRKINA